MVKYLPSMPETVKSFNHYKLHTQYSICEGAIKIEDLEKFCKINKLNSIGICDTSNLCGVLQFSETVSKSKTCVIFINQLRHKIGVMFGSPETTTGGNALKFYSSLRLDIRRIASIKDSDSIIGNRTRVKVVKNKMASPGRMCEFDIMYGEGISYEGDLLDLAVKADIIKKMGSWYSYNEEKIGQGRENAKQYLKDNEKFMVKIKKEVREFIGI